MNHRPIVAGIASWSALIVVSDLNATLTRIAMITLCVSGMAIAAIFASDDMRKGRP